MPPDRPAVRTKGFQKQQAPETNAALAGVGAEQKVPLVIDRASQVESVSLVEQVPQSPRSNAPDPVPRPELIGAAAAVEQAPVGKLMSPPSSASTPTTPRKYQPDNDQERIVRRQWWKYNLYVRSGRQAAENKS